MTENNKKHRGRFQAQGGGVEESESWSQDNPLTESKGRLLLQRLKNKLKPKDYAKRKKAFSKVENFIENSSENGGIFAVLKKTFMVKGSKDERVDIEILGGKAFVKDDENE